MVLTDRSPALRYETTSRFNPHKYLLLLLPKHLAWSNFAGLLVLTQKRIVNPKAFIIHLALFTSLALGSCAFAQDAPNMPPRNQWLTDSVYPTSHFNPAATDSVLFAGPEKGKKLTWDKDVKVVSNLTVSNPTAKKSGADTVIFASGSKSRTKKAEVLRFGS
jgi:hypothetical protein